MRRPGSYSGAKWTCAPRRSRRRRASSRSSTTKPKWLIPGRHVVVVDLAVGRGLEQGEVAVVVADVRGHALAVDRALPPDVEVEEIAVEGDRGVEVGDRHVHVFDVHDRHRKGSSSLEVKECSENFRSRSRARPYAVTYGDGDGAQHPPGHHGPAAVRLARLQRRHDRAHTDDRRARRARPELPPRVHAERHVHAGAGDDAHRSPAAHPRCDLVRAVAPRRHPFDRDPPPRRRGVPHGADRQGALRSRDGPVRRVRRDPARRLGRDRSAARLRARRARDARADGVDPLRRVAARRVPGGRGRVRGPAVAGREPRDRRARVPPEPGTTRAVPHGLDRRPHGRAGSTASPRPTRGSAG